MDPITNEEMLMAAAAGEYDVELPTPITRPEQYWVKIINRINSGGGGSVSPEQIDAAIESYLNSHDADIVTEQELSDALAENIPAPMTDAEIESAFEQATGEYVLPINMGTMAEFKSYVMGE